MATVLTPHCLNQSARRCRSPVKVPKLRTGSGSRSGPTAATCRVAPMSIAAALAWTGDISMRDRLVLGINFSSAEWGGGGDRETSPVGCLCFFLPLFSGVGGGGGGGDGLRYRSIS